MTLSQISLVSALMTEIQRQAGGDVTISQHGLNVLIAAADMVVAQQHAFAPFVKPVPVDAETLPLPLDPIPGWEAA